jgi:hypothetical protein
MSTFLLAISLALGGDGKADGKANAHGKTSADELVKQLGDASFKVREKAARELLARGAKAVDALKRGQENPDQEIRERCRRLLEQIQSRTALDQLKIFLTDLKSAPDRDWPAAERFLALAGNTKAARELYGELLREHRAMLDALAGEPKRAADVCKGLAKDIHERTRAGFGKRRLTEIHVSRVELALILLGSADNRLTMDSLMAYHRAAIVRSATMTQALATADDPLRQMFLSWLEREPDAATIQIGLDIAANVPMKEALPLALKIAGDKGRTAMAQASGLLAVAQLGTKENVKELAPLLSNKTGLANVTFAEAGRQATTVELGDVALGVCIVLSGQDPQEFGFDIRRPQEMRSYTYFGFTGPTQRAAALERWRKLAP